MRLPREMQSVRRRVSAALPACRIATVFVGGLLLTALVAGPAWGQANVDLRNWSEVTLTTATWNVAADGSSVTQTRNGAPTIFLSPNNFLNTTIEGRFRVATTSDDDFIGFVFGLTSPTSPGSTIDALLLDWKKGVQSGANAGFRLSYVTGAIVNSTSTSNPYWTHSTTANTTFQSLDTLTGANATGLGWVANTAYDFTLEYSATDIRVGIQGGSDAYQDGLEVFNINISDPAAVAAFPDGSFPDGRFGFYNFSQAQVVYESFTQTDDPVLVTNPTDGGMLDFGPVRVSGSAMADLSITNGGGVGSNLNGTAGAAAGVFAGPTPDNAFDLAQGASVDKTYSYSPVVRGSDSQGIAIASNAGTHNITLVGTAVGPVFDSVTAPGSALDFGDVAAVALQTLNLSNVTPDDNGGDDDLTDMSVSFEIIGAQADMFALNLLDPQVISKGDTLALEISLDPDGYLGPIAATLRIRTDENTALGNLAGGMVYDYDLTAVGVPEPATMALLGLGTVALVRKRRTA